MIAWSTVNQSLTPISLPIYWARSVGRSTSIIFLLSLALALRLARCSLVPGEIRGLAARPQRMRYTKIALLIFGAGLVLGLIVVVAEIDRLGRSASGLMALGLAGIPIGMIVDWR